MNLLATSDPAAAPAVAGDALDFFETMFPEIPAGLAFTVWEKTKTTKKTFFFDDHARAAAFIEDRRVGGDLYVGQLAKKSDRPTTSRPGNADILGVAGFSLDIDINGGPEGKTGAARDRDEALALAHEILPPTLIVNSGYGIQAWWLLEEPWIFQTVEIRDRAARRLEGWQQAHRSAAGFDLDHTHDLARVMRIPGGMNFKGTDPVPVELLRDYEGPTYSMEPLARVADQHRTSVSMATTGVAGPTINDAMQKLTPSIKAAVATFGQKMSVDLRQKLAELKEIDEKFRGVWDRSAKKTKDWSQSSFDQSIADHCVKHGFKREETARLLFEHRKTAPDGDGDPYGKGSDVRYLARTIAKAEAWWASEQEKKTVVTTEGQGKDRTAVETTTAATVAHALNDAGNAERLIARHERRFRYVDGQGWLVWDGRRWRPDPSGLDVQELAKETVAAMKREAGKVEDDDKSKRAFGWAIKSGSSSRIEGMLKLARSDRRVRIEADDLDADPLLFCIENGTVDLRTGELRDHEPGDLITKMAAVSYDAAATAPRWDRFLQETIGDPEVIAFMQAWAGYLLTGRTDEQCMVFLTGSGANGKSTFVGVMAALLGDHAATVDSSTFTAGGRSGGSASPDRARLPGVRAVFTSEVERGAKLAEVFIKQATGQDKLTARPLYKAEFSFMPQFKVTVACNELPRIEESSHAMWRRVRVVPFPSVIANPDRRLADKLRDELPGILNWALEGARRWLAEGLPELPAAMAEAATEYRAEQDPVVRFIAEYCEQSPGAVTRGPALHAAYVEWGGTLSKIAFGKRLSALGYMKGKDSQDVRIWHGLALFESTGGGS